MNKIPIIKLQLDGIREQITHAFIADSDRLNLYVKKALEVVLTDETLEKRIIVEVEGAVNTAISELSNNYVIKSIITKIVANALIKHQEEKGEKK